MGLPITSWLGIRGLNAAMPRALISGALGLCWMLPAAIIPIQALSLLETAQKVSVLFFAVSVAGVVAAVFIPLVVHVIGRRHLFTLGAGCILGSAVLLSLDTTVSLIIGTALRIVGFLSMDIVIETIIMERVPRRQLARFEAARIFCMGVGFIIGPWLGIWLANHWTFVSPFVLLIVVLAAVYLYTVRSQLAASLDDPRTQTQPPNPLRFVSRFCHQPRLRLAWVLAFARASFWTMFFIYAPIYCVQMGLSEESAGIVLSLGSAAILLAPLFGRIGRRVGVRRLLTLGYLGTGVMTIGVAIVADSAWAGVAFLLLGAVFAAVIDAVGNALFLRAVHSYERPEMTAVFTTYREMAHLSGPGVFSVLLTFFALPSVFVVSGLSMILMTTMTRFIPKRFR